MAINIGFKRLTIQPFKKGKFPLEKDGEAIVIEGKADNGGMVSAELSGIAKEAKTVSASNTGYYISRKGVGEPKVEFEVLDLPVTAETKILGRMQSEKGVQYTGESTEAPYCSILMESNNASGDSAFVGMFYGVFSLDALSLKTEEVGSDFEPENEKLTFTAAANPTTGDYQGMYMAKYAGKDTVAIKEIKDNVLLASAVAASQAPGHTGEQR